MLLEKIQESYDWYIFSIEALASMGIFFFFSLKPSQRGNPSFFLPFIVIMLIFSYEHLGFLTAIYRSSNSFIYDWFYPGHSRDLYNIWLYNFFEIQLSSVIILVHIRNLITGKKLKQMVLWITLSVTALTAGLMLLGFVLLIESEPLMFFLFYGSIIIASGLFFWDLLTNDELLDLDPIRSVAFWQATFIFFYFTSIFLVQISFNFLLSVSPQLLSSLYGGILRILFLLMMGSLLVSLIFPRINEKLEKKLQYV